MRRSEKFMPNLTRGGRQSVSEGLARCCEEMGERRSEKFMPNLTRGGRQSVSEGLARCVGEIEEKE